MEFLTDLSPQTIWTSMPIIGGAIVWVLVEYLVKRNLPEDWSKGKKGRTINLSSAAIGILLSLAVSFIVTDFEAKTLVWAVIAGLLAGGVATLGHEIISNNKEAGLADE